MSYGPSRSRLLLTELICNLAIFALCAVVCACLLLQSWSISRESSELTQAVTLAQTAAEVWRAGRSRQTSPIPSPACRWSVPRRAAR